MTLRTASLIVLFFGGSVATVLFACSNQGEGERCEVENNNEDCASGLVCYPALQLNGTPNSDRCCPSDRTKATQPVCQTQVSVVQDAQTPADTGPAPTVDSGETADATTEADAASDAADAANDADQ